MPRLQGRLGPEKNQRKTVKAWLGLGAGAGREQPLPGREALGVTLLFVLFFSLQPPKWKN